MSELKRITDELTECLRAGLESADRLRSIARRLDLLAHSARSLAARADIDSPDYVPAAAAARTASLLEQAARQCVRAAPQLEQAHRLGMRWVATAGESAFTESLLAPDPVDEAAARARDAQRQA
ncbi:hypothetical protein ACFVMC_28495 [Nocardia sp. NPDC127579]|uniref:hypothetical protein n=1 Tax=Nocardia sp. NPDC127579 TaxID=3345402 RepID=UPI00362628EE